jgi:ABC-type uncharacterized transport system involved in gliding motility auxiliary subunit
LKDPVKVKVFLLGNDTFDGPIKDLLRLYKAESSKFSYDYLILDKEPIEAKKYALQMPSLVFEMGKKSEVITYNDLFPGQAPQPFSGEQRFTQLLINMLAENQKKIYILTGHEGLTVETAGQFDQQLQSEGYTVESLNLVREGKIPTDADAIFALGPMVDWSDAERTLITQYLQGNGKLLLTLDYANGMADQKNVDGLLKDYGITNQRTIVLQLNDNLANNPLITVPYFNEHKINEKLISSDKPTVLASSISLTDEDNQTKWTLTPLLKTSEFAFAKKDRSILTKQDVALADLQQTDKDIGGPLNLAYAVESAEGKSKIVVVGNTMFLSDTFFSQYGNRDFAMNSVAWLTENENLVSIRPIEQSVVKEPLSSLQFMTISIGLLIVIPLTLLTIGIVIWWRRRKA